MSKWYYIKLNNRTNKYFSNLCGNFILVDSYLEASRWDEVDHKAMWYFLHELKATTNQDWIVVEIDEDTGKEVVCSESERARKHLLTRSQTIENVQFEAVLEEQTFNEAFKGNKPEPESSYYIILRINGKIKYIPVAKVNGKYYRYKHGLPANDMTDNMWSW